MVASAAKCPSSATTVSTAAQAGSTRTAQFSILVLYMLVHAAQLLHQLQLTLSGQASMLRTLLLVHEVHTLVHSGYMLQGLHQHMSDARLADFSLVQLLYILPVFHHLMTLTAADASHSISLQRWASLQAVHMILGVVFRMRPAMSLIQSLVMPLTYMSLPCSMHLQPQQATCTMTVLGRLACMSKSWAAITLSGLIAWVVAHTLASKHTLNGLSSPPPETAQTDSNSHENKGKAAGMQGSGSSAQAEAREPPTPSSAKPQELCSAGGASSSATRQDCPGMQLPLESFGIFVFRSMGLAPAMQQLELRLSRLVGRMDEAMLMRAICIPLAAYSLVFAACAHHRFMGCSFCSLEGGTFILLLTAWFMLGRDSVKFDMMCALGQVQAQLAASLAAMAKPRQQTVSELVDSVRQQMAGPDAVLASTHGHGADDDIQLLEPLGEGMFGKVFKGVWRGTVVAVKSMVLPGNSRRERMAIMEAAISSALSHPNVLQTYTYSLHPIRDAATAPMCNSRHVLAGNSEGAKQMQFELSAPAGEGSAPTPCTNGFEVRLVLEFMDRGTLRDALDKGKLLAPSGFHINYEAVLDTAADIAKGMLHLHSLNIIHSDLKARNVLLTSSATDPRGFTAKISDFGLSHKMEAEETHVSKMFQGTPTHMAPEVFMSGSQSKGADVYSYGITLWELYTARRPFGDLTPALLPAHVLEKGLRPVFPPGAPRAYVQLAQRCWRADVKSRPSFKDIVAILAEIRDHEARRSGRGTAASALRRTAASSSLAVPAERRQSSAYSPQKPPRRATVSADLGRSLFEVPSAILVGHGDAEHLDSLGHLPMAADHEQEVGHLVDSEADSGGEASKGGSPVLDKALCDERSSRGKQGPQGSALQEELLGGGGGVARTAVDMSQTVCEVPSGIVIGRPGADNMDDTWSL